MDSSSFNPTRLFTMSSMNSWKRAITRNMRSLLLQHGPYAKSSNRVRRTLKQAISWRKKENWLWLLDGKGKKKKKVGITEKAWCSNLFDSSVSLFFSSPFVFCDWSGVHQKWKSLHDGKREREREGQRESAGYIRRKGSRRRRIARRRASNCFLQSIHPRFRYDSDRFSCSFLCWDTICPTA